MEQAELVLGNIPKRQKGGESLAELFDAFTNQLIRALKTCSAEAVQVECITFEKLEQTKAAMLNPNTKYICFDSQSKLGIPFGVSRCFDLTTGLKLGITSRPGWNELHEQTTSLKQIHGTKFGIIEDDIFTGSTLRYMIEGFKRSGITITEIISGISTTHSVSDVPVRAVAYYDQHDLLEITDPRDYLFGARDGGLVVSNRGQKLRVPYDAGFVDVSARSSINKNKITDFTRLVRKANYYLHKSLGSLDYPARIFYPSELLCQTGLADNCTLGDMLEIEAWGQVV